IAVRLRLLFHLEPERGERLLRVRARPFDFVAALLFALAVLDHLCGVAPRLAFGAQAWSSPESLVHFRHSVSSIRRRSSLHRSAARPASRGGSDPLAARRPTPPQSPAFSSGGNRSPDGGTQLRRTGRALRWHLR